MNKETLQQRHLKVQPFGLFSDLAGGSIVLAGTAGMQRLQEDSVKKLRQYLKKNQGDTNLTGHVVCNKQSTH